MPPSIIINMEKNKILFFDLETASNFRNYETMQDEAPRFAELWMKRDHFLRERYEENRGLTVSELFEQKAGLQPEFARVVCASFGYFDSTGNKKIVSYTDSDVGNEKEILMASKGVINNAERAGWKLCGHNVRRFDIPFLWKRMLTHKIQPPGLINSWGKKPWEMTTIDTAELWSGGVWQESFTSLDTLSALFDIPSPKATMQASRVHGLYWSTGNKDFSVDIAEYCEGDVIAVMDIVDNIIKTL